jgi:hypothetical protein
MWLSETSKSEDDITDDEGISHGDLMALSMKPENADAREMKI